MKTLAKSTFALVALSLLLAACNAPEAMPPKVFEIESERSVFSISDCITSPEGDSLFQEIELAPISFRFEPFPPRDLYVTGNGTLISINTETGGQVLAARSNKRLTPAQVAFLRGCA
jgi:hypothetical protein